MVCKYSFSTSFRYFITFVTRLLSQTFSAKIQTGNICYIIIFLDQQKTSNNACFSFITYKQRFFVAKCLSFSALSLSVFALFCKKTLHQKRAPAILARALYLTS